MAHLVDHPERTAYRYPTLNLREPEYKVFRTRGALAKAVRKQEARGASANDWTPVVGLGSNEGY